VASQRSLPGRELARAEAALHLWDEDPARWAVETAERALGGVEDVLASGGLGLYG
jgi:hypothetical protein